MERVTFLYDGNAIFCQIVSRRVTHYGVIDEENMLGIVVLCMKY